MFLALPLWSNKKPCVPIGPNFNKAKWVQIDFSGTKVKIKLNRDSPEYWDMEPEHPLKFYDINNPSTFRGEKLWGDFITRRCLLRRYGFRGPIFSGYAAEICCVYSFSRVVSADKNYSLFNPEVFQEVIDQRIIQRYKSEVLRLYGRNKADAPVAWRVMQVTDAPLPAVCFIHEPAPEIADIRVITMNFPLSHNIMVNINCEIAQIMGGDQAERDYFIKPEPMLKLVDNIYQSVQVELSPEAKADLLDVQARNPKAKLSQHREPLNLMTPEQEAEWKAYLEFRAEAKKQGGLIDYALLQRKEKASKKSD